MRLPRSRSTSTCSTSGSSSIWSGLLLLVMQVVMHRPRRTRPRRTTWDDRTDQWYEQDVHRPGYAGETRQLPTVRDGRRR